MSKLELIETIVIGVIALGLGIYYIIKAIKNKWLTKLADIIKIAITEAEEKYPEGHGDEKKKLVLAKISEECEKYDIPFAFIYKYTSKLIDTIIKHYNVISHKGE